MSSVSPIRRAAVPEKKPRSATKSRRNVLPAVPQRMRRLIRQALASIAAGFLPIASYVLVHAEASSGKPWLFLLVACALAFSAPTLANWAYGWCGGKVKAWGFTLLLEGVMIFSGISMLNLAGLTILLAINSAYAWELASQTEAERAKQLREAKRR